jgi:type IV pilus assembly protein PilW
MKHTHTDRQPRLAAQRGFSLVELSVAVVIAVFLLAGLFTVFQGTRTTSADQTALAQLQDNERMALSIITDTVQSAGYFPGAPTNTLTQELPADGGHPTAGQSISGWDNGAQGVNLQIRYVTAPNDGILNCMGTSNTTGAPVTWLNTFSVSTSNQLLCSNGNGVTGVAIANGVQSLNVRYAVNTTASTQGTANTNCPADSYVLPDNMTTLDWSNICAIEVTLVFINPLYQLTTNGPIDTNQPATVTIQRLIGIPTKSGVSNVTITAS